MSGIYRIIKKLLLLGNPKIRHTFFPEYLKLTKSETTYFPYTELVVASHMHFSRLMQKTRGFVIHQAYTGDRKVLLNLRKVLGADPLM